MAAMAAMAEVRGNRRRSATTDNKEQMAVVNSGSSE